MWFLTNEGMDRYNGKEIKHYKLADEENKRNAQNHLTWLFREKENLWIVGKTGKIFEYHHQFDRFIPTYKPANLSLSISYSYLDNRGNIWLCDKDSIIYIIRRVIKFTYLQPTEQQHYLYGTIRQLPFLYCDRKREYAIAV